MKANFELKGLKEIYNLTKEGINIVAGEKITATSYISDKFSESLIIVGMTLEGEITKRGSVHLIGDIIKSIKVKNADIELTEEQLIVNNRKFSFKSIEPNKEKIDLGEKIATLTKEDYEKIINVEYALEKCGARPIMENILVDEENIVALDVFRMAVRKNSVKFKDDAEKKTILINSSVVKLMKKIKPINNTVEVYKNKSMVTIKIDNITITYAECEGVFIKYKQILPQENLLDVEIPVKDVLEVLKSYSKNDKTLKLTISKEKMIMETKNDSFKTEDEIKVKSTGDIEIAVNPIYLKDALDNYNDSVIMKFNNNVAPIVIKKGDCIDLVLPVRLKR